MKKIAWPARFGSLAAAVTLGLVMFAGPGAGVAHASYGGTSTQDQWQVGLSYNCNDASSDFCLDESGQPNTGGFWGWVVFDATPGQVWGQQVGTGDAALAGCGHFQGGGGAGAVALDDIEWHAGPAQPQDPNYDPSTTTYDFYLDSYTVTFKGHGQPQTFTSSDVPDFLGDSGIPLEPGHYQFHPQPAVNGMVQVAYRPARG